MTDSYNQPGKTYKPNEYTRVRLYCPRCLTPLTANREKDAPHFCPVCHTIPKWKHVDNEFLQQYAEAMEVTQ